MSSIFDVALSSDSEEDADYVPIPSERPSDLSEDENISDGDLEAKPKSKSRNRRTKKNDIPESEPVISSTSPAIDEKKRADDLWKSFLSDVDVPIKKTTTPGVKAAETVTRNESESQATESVPESKKPTTVDVFEFAGETFTVDKDLNSSPCAHEFDANLSVAETSTSRQAAAALPKKRGGLSSVMDTILNKKQKMTVLDKTLYDWKSFKKDEGLDSDLQTYNKGKSGFIERKRFLERSDLRSFELEKNMRTTKRRKD